MKKFLAAAVIAISTAFAAAQPSAPVKVTWQTLGNETDSAGNNFYTQRLTVSGVLDFDMLAFNQFARRMHTLNPADTLREIVPGYYVIASPRFRESADSVVIDIVTRGAMQNVCYEPDGFHTVTLPSGLTGQVELTRRSLLDSPSLYATHKVNRMPPADEIYRLNERLAEAASTASPYDIIPSFKSVTKTGRHTVTPLRKTFKTVAPTDSLGTYRIVIAGGEARVEAPQQSAAVARRRLDTLLDGLPDGTVIDEAVIVDRPDFGYRGVMIDIARNYQTPAQMRRILDLMSHYGFNILHFHFADDEAWRVDIPGLPELVAVGGRRGYAPDESEHLWQIFCGDGNPASVNTSNGFFTTDDFIGMLRYADSLGISVLPEIESPGHARAAIKAMERRARVSGDSTLVLTEAADSSVYTSAQAFHDNILNPALESTYRFMFRVFNGLIDLYAQAGVALPAIHIGGDEVPRNAWTRSPAAHALADSLGYETQKQLHAHFVRQLNDYLASRGVRLSGWQDIATGRMDEYNAAVSPNVFSINSWTLSSKSDNSPSRQALEGGYPVVLSNVDRFYLDMVYSYHPDERGLSWGGTVDEFKSLGGYPSSLCIVRPDDRGRIIGVSGQLFAETIRSAAGQEELLLPKMLGLAERAWNADSTYSVERFNDVIARREIPYWQRAGYNYHLRQPGIISDGQHAHFNSPYKGIGEIRYTIDGSDPSDASPAADGEPVAIPAGTKEIRAAYFLNGRRSVTTILYL